MSLLRGLPGGQARWDDWRFPLIRSQQGVLDKPDYDYTRHGLLFPQNDTSEIAYLGDQQSHLWLPESGMQPHLHYLQEQATSPTFVMRYRFQFNGGAFTSGWNTLTQDGNAFTYVSGDLNQIATFPAIDMTGITDLSYLMEIELWRDDNDVTGDVLGKSFDIHRQLSGWGSRQPFVL